MEKNIILKFVSILTLLNLINIVCSRKLIFVYEHVRHGARGPSSSYDSIFYNGKDEYNVSWITDGELSQIGKRQHYLLGVRNRHKYKDLINFDHYNPMEILIHATDYNRTHQSINSELLGMFGNAKEERLNEKEKDYFMVNTKYMEKDLLGKIEDELKKIDNQVNNNSLPLFNIRRFPPNRIFLVDHCTKISQYRDEHVLPKVKEFYKEFKRDYQEAFKQFIDPSNFENYNRMKSITDHFICDYDNNKDLTIVSEKGIDLKKFLDFSKRFYGSFIFDWFVDNFTCGLEETHLMQDLIGYMERRIKNKDKTTYKAPKMVMDCGHDTTVGPIARYMSSAFNVSYHPFCEFACNVYYELYEESDGKYTVDYYLDDELLIDQMEFSKFKETMESKYWNDSYADEFCGKKEDTYIGISKFLHKHSKTLLGTAIIFCVLFLISATFTFVFFRKIKSLEDKLKENQLVNKEIEGSEMPKLD